MNATPVPLTVMSPMRVQAAISAGERAATSARSVVESRAREAFGAAVSSVMVIDHPSCTYLNSAQVNGVQVRVGLPVVNGRATEPACATPCRLVDRAIGVLDGYGLADLSMRRLAS